jgi:hypothetical protein
MGNDDNKETKPQPHQEGGGHRGRRGRRSGGHFTNPRGDAGSYRSSVKGIESDIFDLGASRDNAAQFTRSVKNIANYVHHHHPESSDIAAAIKTLTKATILVPSPQVAKEIKHATKVDIGGEFLKTWRLRSRAGSTTLTSTSGAMPTAPLRSAPAPTTS